MPARLTASSSRSSARRSPNWRTAPGPSAGSAAGSASRSAGWTSRCCTEGHRRRRAFPSGRLGVTGISPSLRTDVLAPLGVVYPDRGGANTADVAATAAAERTLILPDSSSIAGKAVRVAFDGGQLTSDAGVLLLADIERRLGLAERLARCIEDPRSPERVRHTVPEMIRFRVLLIAAGYQDANDCDTLRSDPAFKMAVGRLPGSGRALCSQPTMCRLENLPMVTALKRMMAAMVELFCDSFEQVPTRICSTSTTPATLRTATRSLPC